MKPVSLAKAREMEPEFNAIIASEDGVDELMELGERLEAIVSLIAPVCDRFWNPVGFLP